jgi:hypothetical protein
MLGTAKIFISQLWQVVGVTIPVSNRIVSKFNFRLLIYEKIWYKIEDD